MHIEAVSFIRFSSLMHAGQLERPFSGPSYGSGASEFVMCYPHTLADELEEEYDQPPEQLIQELRAIPDGVLVALDG